VKSLRIALNTVLVLFFLVTLVAGQQLISAHFPAPITTPTTAFPSLAENGNESAQLKIFFTGRLLGYYRLPEWQSADFETLCPPPGSSTVPEGPPQNTPADAFLSKEYHPDGDILVGMGDNFGVTLESRAYLAPTSQGNPPQLHAKSRDLKEWPADAPAEQIGDNVGCFFSRAGYDAIVPGKEDFYFGPERLRRIADRLAKSPLENKVNGLHPVRMLGANLVLKTDFLKKPPEIPDSDKALKFVPGMPTGVKSMDISDKGTIPPFTRQIRFEISSTSPYFTERNAVKEMKDPASELKFRPFLCSIDSHEGWDRLDPLTCEKNAKKTASNKKFLSNPQPEKAEPDSACDKTVLDFDLPDDLASESPSLYGLCAKSDRGDHPTGRLDDNVYFDKNDDRKYFCLRFAVVPTFFGNAKTHPWVLKTLADKNGKKHYTVIFGVVDKDLTTLIGRDNLSWRNEQKKARPGQVKDKPVPPGKETYSTSVDAMDEATALGFAMREFDLWRKKQLNDEASVYKVLLAQMTRGKAETLAANLAEANFSDTSLGFDVVISAAAAFPAATANEDVVFYRPLKPELTRKPFTNPACEDRKVKEADEPLDFRQLVVVPWLGYDLDHKRVPDPLRSLTLTDSPMSEKAQTRNFKVEGHYEKTFPLSETVDQDKLRACYDVLGQKYLAFSRRGYWRDQLPPGEDKRTANELACASPSRPESTPKTTAPKVENAFQLAVLAALRDRTHSDVAMLQKRSFYWGPFPVPLDGQQSLEKANGQLLDRILWMGDYLEVIPVKGSTLKKVLDESDQFDALDEQATSEIVEAGRGVLALGLEKTRDKQYLVDGMQLDPNRLYTVATSNHITAGDNGYPELAEFVDRRLPAVDKDDKDADDQTPRISSVVCQALGAQFGDNLCVYNPGLLFATIQQLPPQLEPTTLSFFRAYQRSVLGTPQLPRDAYSRTNYQAQLNPTWRISLKDLSFNLSSVRNNLTEPERLTKLGGVTEPGAGNAKAHTINFSSHSEWVRSGKWVDEFVRALGEYQETVTGNTATVPILSSTGTLNNVLYPAPALTTFSKNQFATDAGIFWHPGWLWRPAGHKYFDKIGLVFQPLHFDTQIARQSFDLAAVYDPAGTGNILIPAISLPIARVRNILPARIAFRTESDKNHLEVGYQGGWERNALKSLTTNLGTCPALIITLCLETQELQSGFLASSITQALGTRERHGPYADLDWTWPLIWKLGFRTQESFAYYGPAHLDNAIDTLYRNDVTETLNFQLFPNLNIGPSLERFDYENKIEHVHLRTWSPSFKLTYSFDWLEGSKIRKSLRYSPTSASGGSE
jgi:hypothetical protein